MAPRRYFIAGTGTGIGKTHVTALLCRTLKRRGIPVDACKPVVSGGEGPGGDTQRLLESLGLPATPEAVAKLSPWRFAAPLSPSMAARAEGRVIESRDVAAFSRDYGAGAEIVFIESAGGVMSPLDDAHTMLDWAVACAMPVILVGGTYLGAISHALSAYAVLAARGAAPVALVLSESEEGVSPEETKAELKRFLPAGLELPILPRQEEYAIPPESFTAWAATL